MKLSAIVDALEALVPSETAEEWDNVGLLVARSDENITRIMVCLDFTEEVLAQAVEQNCEMIVTHHPVIFKPIRRITNPLLLAAVRQNICVYACHTNLDVAAGGVNDVLAERIGLQNVETIGMLRVGELPEKRPTEAFLEHIKTALSVSALRVAGDVESVSRVAVLGGAGGDFLKTAAEEEKCDAFVTGEASYHMYELAKASRVLLVCAGHFETEAPAMDAFGSMLRAKLHGVEVICASMQNPFPVR